MFPLAACVCAPLVVDLSVNGLQTHELISWARLSLFVDRSGAIHRSGGAAARCTDPHGLDGEALWDAGVLRAPRTSSLPEVADALLARGVSLVSTDTLIPDETPAEGAEGAHTFKFFLRHILRQGWRHRREPDESRGARRSAAREWEMGHGPRPTPARWRTAPARAYSNAPFRRLRAASQQVPAALG